MLQSEACSKRVCSNAWGSKTFSPAVKSCTVGIVITLTIYYGWDIKQLDVNNAFLNGILTDDVYVSQPDGIIDSHRSSHICKLHQALYGLKQALHAWFERLSCALLDWGFVN